MEPYQEKDVTRVFGIVVSIDRYTAYRPKTVAYQEAYIDNEMVQKQVTKYRNTTVNKPITKYRTVTKTKSEPYQTTETRTRQVQKTREVPVYQQRTRRNFN